MKKHESHLELLMFEKELFKLLISDEEEEYEMYGIKYGSRTEAIILKVEQLIELKNEVNKSRDFINWVVAKISGYKAGEVLTAWSLFKGVTRSFFFYLLIAVIVLLIIK